MKNSIENGTNEAVLLSSLKVGNKGRIEEISIKNSYIKKHLLDMGITIGVVVEIKKIAPMGDPIEIEVRGYRLCIRKKEMDSIMVKII